MPSYNITNPPRNLSLDNARSFWHQYGSLAKVARYYVRILPVGTDNVISRLGYTTFLSELSYLCESAELPGRGFMNADLRYYGPSFKLPFQTSYEDTTLTFLCRSGSFERQLFDDWLEAINPTNSFDFEYRDNYRCEIQIYQLAEFAAAEGNEPGAGEASRDPAAIYKFSLHDAWPILVNAQPVTWSDDNIHRLAVMFTYRKWTRPGRDLAPRSISNLVNGSSSSQMGTTISGGTGLSTASGNPNPASAFDGGGTSGGGGGGGGGGGF